MSCSALSKVGHCPYSLCSITDEYYRIVAPRWFQWVERNVLLYFTERLAERHWHLLSTVSIEDWSTRLHFKEVLTTLRRLDISPSSVHTRRRIWQESITTLFMTSPDCAISKTQNMTFAQAPDAQYPPYLLDFSGSPSERHVENLKVSLACSSCSYRYWYSPTQILREVGLSSYNKAVALVYGPDTTWFRTLEAQIQDHFVGPDCYWKSPTEKINPGYTKFFGNGWWIPFPPTLVCRV